MPTYSAGPNGLTVSMDAYDPKIGETENRKIRHMQLVVDHLMKKAQECLDMTSDHFHIVLSNNPENTGRVRMWRRRMMRASTRSWPTACC